MAPPSLFFPMAAYTATGPGAIYATGLRRPWTATLRVGGVGSSLTLTLRGSPTGETGTWSVLKTITTPALGTVVLKSKQADGSSDWDVLAHHYWLSAEITAISGSWTFALEGTAPFFDPKVAADRALLTRELGDYTGCERLCAQAEDDVIDYLTVPSRQQIAGPWVDVWRPPILALLGRTPWDPPRYDTNVDVMEKAAFTPKGTTFSFEAQLAGAYDAIRGEIVRQAEFLFRREILMQDRSAAAIYAVRDMGNVAQGFGDSLDVFRNSTLSTKVWRGR